MRELREAATLYETDAKKLLDSLTGFLHMYATALPAKNDAQRNEMLTATGFLTLGPKSLNTRNQEQFRMDVADEMLDVATRGVCLGTIGS